MEIDLLQGSGATLVALLTAVVWSIFFAFVQLWLLTIGIRRPQQAHAGYTVEPEKHGTPLASQLLHKQQDLHEIVRKLDDDPALEQLLVAAMRQRSRNTRWRQFAIATLGNAASILAGWLLSGLVNPTSILALLHL